MAQTSLHKAFSTLTDKRINRCKKHNLIDIIILSILAVLSGAESYDAIELYGRTHIDFLKQFLQLKNGIPSHDTINRVFQTLNSRAFELCFISWVQGLVKIKTEKGVIAIDGKTARGSKDSFHNKSPLHSVHAWSVEHGICLGQMQCSEKSNEITAIPKLLEWIDIEDKIITIDAMGTQTKIADKIIEQGGDYILAVKGNQGSLEEEVKTLCSKSVAVSDVCEVEKGHGRIETRRCEVFATNLMVDKTGRWKQLTSVIKITATREMKNKIEMHERFYISSLATDNDFNRFIRSHWSVENNLHWVLDCIFHEDHQRKRANNAAANFALVRKIVLNILKKDSGKGSIQNKRLNAAWNNDFLLKLINI